MTGTCSFWVWVGTFILILIGLEVVHVDLGRRGDKEEELSQVSATVLGAQNRLEIALY